MSSRRPEKGGSDGLRGQRLICLVRQSKDNDGTTSSEAQLETLRLAGEQIGLTHVDDVVLTGVTGSLPALRDDLRELFQRKRERDDFDVIMVQRLDRLTRGGTDHGGWIRHQAAIHGIKVISLDDDLPDGPFSGALRAFKFEAAREQAKSIGERSTQGWLHSFKQGSNCIIAQTPFACDRLYCSSDGEPLFIIRNLGDGRQQKLDPQSNEVIDTYGRIGGGSEGHYRKQRSERPEICPGNPAKIEIVQRIAQLHWEKGWGGTRIANDLNRRGWPSPTGKRWQARQVESIYENPIYCGWAVGNVVSQGIYYRRGADGPEPTNHSEEVLANARSAPRRLRAPEEWVWQEQPQMKDFLPPAIRDKAIAEIRKLLVHRYECSLDPSRKRRSTNKHKDSPYLLTGLLFAVQDGQPLTGVLTGKKGNQKRKYRCRKTGRGYMTGSVYNRLLDAAALEDAVLNLISDILKDVPELRRCVEAVTKEATASGDLQTELDGLRDQRKQIAEQSRRVLALAAGDEKLMEDAKSLLVDLRTRREDLDRRIAELERLTGLNEFDPDSVVDAILERFKSLGASDLQSLDISAQRELVNAFVERVEADLSTKDAVIHLKFPPWSPLSGSQRGCLANSSLSPTVDETLTVRLAWADCEYVNVVGSNRPVTYRCRRRPAA